MSKTLFQQAVEEAFLKVKQQVCQEFTSPDFDWDFFANIMLKDGTPLVHIFSAKAMQYAELYSMAKKMATIADDIVEEE